VGEAAVGEAAGGSVGFVLIEVGAGVAVCVLEVEPHAAMNKNGRRNAGRYRFIV